MRYSNSKILANTNEKYQQYFADRGVVLINTLENSKLVYPTQEQINTLLLERHVWKDTDRFYKLSYQYYNNPKFWWIIPFFNKRPLESDYFPGDVVFVPKPIEKFIGMIGLR